MAINQIKSEHVRLSILIALSEDAGYQLNSSMIGDILKHYHLKSSRDEVHTELAWLERNGYVKLEKLSANTWLATISQSGVDVVEGSIVVPGIKRPSPRS
ncbi:hypothetical protein DS2_10387 [Catenovulum agarivorans DS-2]|uniref:ArsR family transcriptional regulator n=1 Tax=Catenovulum agarivorans DS-2 TaxID=1328313 RepID=W7QD59_9ALTE|nr:hypothetical protein [Catenovulum agarivorans]EWH09851.1 hypothetical protein DS2_10387 [Catenovulum agarivorans DS-2]